MAMADNFSFCVVEAIDRSDDASPKKLFQFEQRVLDDGRLLRQKTFIMDLPEETGYQVFEHGDYVAVSDFGIVNLKDRTSVPIADDWNPLGICSELGVVLVQRHGEHIEFWDLMTAQPLRSSAQDESLRNANIVAVRDKKIYVVRATPDKSWDAVSKRELEIWILSKTDAGSGAEVEVELKFQESHSVVVKNKMLIHHYIPEKETWRVSISVGDNDPHWRRFLPCVVMGPFWRLGELLKLPCTFPGSGAVHFSRDKIFCVNDFSQVAVYDFVKHDFGPWRSYFETS
jgi:hypothetical protein